MSLEVDMVPACRDSGLHPDVWFPDLERGDKRRASLEDALLALQVCDACPIKKACLSFAMQDIDAIGYGIYGGTLPYERLEKGALQWNARTIFEYQRQIRDMAVKKYNLKCPPIPQNVKPERVFNTNHLSGAIKRQPVQSVADDDESQQAG